METTEKKGLVFFDSSNIDLVLREIGWDEKRLENEKCAVCSCQLTKENIGGFTRKSPIKGVCKKFECVMSALLAEKKESLL